MTKLFDITGMKFTRLTVISRAANSKAGQTCWNCRCDCGNEVVVQGAALKDGHSKSCGCIKTEQTIAMNTKHGHTAKGISPTYHSWTAMISRCTDANDARFPPYGGRGIAVCPEWRDFRNFLRDMGEKPDGMSLDRVDVNGNYEPSNCRWATATEQARNKRNNRRLTFNGETRLVREWADLYGLPFTALMHRLNAGWSTEDALMKPSDGVANKPSLRLITHEGETHSVSGWARKLGVKPGLLFSRLYAGWSIDKALKTD